MLCEDDGVVIGLDAGLENGLLMSPALVQSHISSKLVLPKTTAAAGVQMQISSREGDLLSILVIHHVSVPERGEW